MAKSSNVASVDEFKKTLTRTVTPAKVLTESAEALEQDYAVSRMRTSYEAEIKDLKERLQVLQNQITLREARDRERMRMDQDKLRRLSPVEMRQKFDDILQAHNCDPAEEMVTMVMARDDQGRYLLTPDMRIKLLTTLNKFRMPELKAVETTGTILHDHRVLVMKFGDTLDKAKDVTPIQNNPVLGIGVGE